MNAVQHIIETVLSALVRQPEVYTTVVYPTRGKAVVVHDGLDIAPEGAWYETYPFQRFLCSNHAA